MLEIDNRAGVCLQTQIRALARLEDKEAIEAGTSRDTGDLGGAFELLPFCPPALQGLSTLVCIITAFYIKPREEELLPWSAVTNSETEISTLAMISYAINIYFLRECTVPL